MTKNNPNTLIKILILLSFTMSIVYALNSHKTIEAYGEMSTKTLEAQVEKLSRDGQLPFKMGQELIHRWSQEEL